MTSEILVSAPQLNDLISDGICLVVDCRFDLTNAGKGRADWITAHIPGAVYAHLDDDLAAPVQADTGRHPLPEPARFAGFLASLGWSGDKLLVAYDEGSNAISARLVVDDEILRQACCFAGRGLAGMAGGRLFTGVRGNTSFHFCHGAAGGRSRHDRFRRFYQSAAGFGASSCIGCQGARTLFRRG